MAIGNIGSPVSWTTGTVITPTWLQAVQDNINSWIAGTGPSLVSLALDGVGGAVPTNPPGSLLVSGTGTATSLPTASITRSVLFREMIPFFIWSGTYSGSFTTYGAYNVASMTHAATGAYQINLQTAFSGTLNRMACVTNVIGAGFGFAQAGTTGRIDVSLSNTSNASTDLAATIVGYWL